MKKNIFDIIIIICFTIMLLVVSIDIISIKRDINKIRVQINEKYSEFVNIIEKYHILIDKMLKGNKNEKSQ